MYNYKLENENKKFVKFPLTKSDQLYKSSEILVSKETQTCQFKADLALTTNSMTTPNVATLTKNNLDPDLPKSPSAPPHLDPHLQYHFQFYKQEIH